VRPAGTSEEGWQQHLAALRRLSDADRVRRSFELSDLMRAMAAAGVRQRHPDYGEQQVEMAVHRLRLGDELVAAAWPDRPLVEP